MKEQQWVSIMNLKLVSRLCRESVSPAHRFGVSLASFRSLTFSLQRGGYMSDLLASFDSAHHGQPSKCSKRPKETAGFEENRPRYAPLADIQRCCSI
jgi:hypothetical protein